PGRRHRDQPLTPFRQKGDNTDMTGRTGTTASLGDPRHTPHGFSGGTPTQSPTRITPRNDAATQRSRAVFSAQHEPTRAPGRARTDTGALLRGRPLPFGLRGLYEASQARRAMSAILPNPCGLRRI